MAAAAADKKEKEAGPSFDEVESRQHLYEMRAKKRNEILKSKMKKDGTVGIYKVFSYKYFQVGSTVAEKVFDENSDWTVVTADSAEPANEEPSSDAHQKKKLKKKKKRKLTEEEASVPPEQNIDALFESAEKQLIDKYRQVCL